LAQVNSDNITRHDKFKNFLSISFGYFVILLKLCFGFGFALYFFYIVYSHGMVSFQTEPKGAVVTYSKSLYCFKTLIIPLPK